MKGGEPEIPMYKVIESKGPTNTRIYTVAVYFKGKRLAEAAGHSIQQAEMNAAKKALKLSQGLFPQLDHQKRVISKSMNHQTPGNNQKHLRQSNMKTSRRGNHEEPETQRTMKPNSPSNNGLDRNRRSRTPPLAYQSRNNPETTELIKNKRKKSIDDQEKKTPCCKNEGFKNDSLPERKEIQCLEKGDGTKQSSCGWSNKQRESGSISNSQETIARGENNPNLKVKIENRACLRVRPASELCEDHLSKSSICNRPSNLPVLRRSRSLSNERVKRSNSQRNIRSHNHSSQSRNVSSSKMVLNRNKSRSPARHRSRRSRSISPKRYYSPESRKPPRRKSRSPLKYVSSSQEKFGRKNSTSPYRNISSERPSRSPSRDLERKRFMDFMLGRQSSPGTESNWGGSTHISNYQPGGAHQFQDTFGQTRANVPAGFHRPPRNSSVQSMNDPLSPNIHVPPPSNNHLPPPSLDSPSHTLQKLPPPFLKNSAPFHQGPPPILHKPPPNLHQPPPNLHEPPHSMCNVNFSSPPPNNPILPKHNRSFHPSYKEGSFPAAPPTTSVPPPNSRIPPPNTHVHSSLYAPPNHHIPPRNHHLPPPMPKHGFANVDPNSRYSQTKFYQQ